MSNPDEWVDALVEAASDVAQMALGFEGFTVLGPAEAGGGDGGAAWLAVHGEHAVHIGIGGQVEDCAALGRALLMLEPEDEIEFDDLIDAVNEIANILGGGVKLRMSERHPSLKLGLPEFIAGPDHVSRQQQSHAVAVMLGPIPAQLFVAPAA